MSNHRSGEALMGLEADGVLRQKVPDLQCAHPWVLGRAWTTSSAWMEVEEMLGPHMRW